MSQIIDKDIKIKAGYLVKVENTEIPKFSNANKEYYACWVEDENGKNERCILFTEKEINGFSDVSLNRVLTFGRLEYIKIGNREGFVVKLNYKNVGEKNVFISKKVLLSADLRASKNQEDLTTKSFMTNLFD